MATITEKPSLSEQIVKLARCGELATTGGILLMIGALVYGGYVVMFDHNTVDAVIKETFLTKQSPLALSSFERVLGAALLSLPDLCGLAAFYYARKLLIAYQQGHVFTLMSSATIEVIGWLIFSIAVVNIIMTLVGGFVFGVLEKAGQANVRLTFEDTDAYAIILGLLLVIIGHVMYEAVRISDENKAMI